MADIADGSDSKWQPELIDLSQVNGAFSFEEGYSRPDWQVISQAIRERIAGSHDLNTAWTEAARQWVMQLQSDLGGDYQVKDSPHFILLTALDADRRKTSRFCGEHPGSNLRGVEGCGLDRRERQARDSPVPGGG